MKAGDLVIYNSSDTCYSNYNGQTAHIIRVINKPDNFHDAEVLPMYELRLSNGVILEAWADEIGA